MENSYTVQLGGIFLLLIGLVGLALKGDLLGTLLSNQEKRRLGGDWDKQGTVYRVSFRWDSFLFPALVLIGTFLLLFTHFDPCGFLAYWVPGLPPDIRTAIMCR